jgi:hypothetical protein
MSDPFQLLRWAMTLYGAIFLEHRNEICGGDVTRVKTIIAIAVPVTAWGLMRCARPKKTAP